MTDIETVHFVGSIDVIKICQQGIVHADTAYSMTAKMNAFSFLFFPDLGKHVPGDMGELSENWKVI